MKKHIVANWKMNGTKASMTEYVSTLKKLIKKELLIDSEVEVIICAPNVYLDKLNSLIADLPISTGGQDCHGFAKGAFTGETSAEMLTDIGCRYVLTGHSERRKYHGEDEAVIQGKVIAAQRSGLIPIVCIGESLVEYEQNATLEVLKHQLSILEGNTGEVLIAYEPDWAVGTGVTPKPQDVQNTHVLIAKEYKRITGKEAGVIYGGSINPTNALDFLASNEVSGVLVGGASLSADSFFQIIKLGLQC